MAKINNLSSWISPAAPDLSYSPPPQAGRVAVMFFSPGASGGCDQFDAGQTPSFGRRLGGESADAYCNWPGRDAAPDGDDASLPRAVLTQAAQSRFATFQAKTFGHQVDASRLPEAVAQLFATIPAAKSVTFHRVKIAGVPVYAMAYKSASTTYVVLADRDGEELADGCYPPSTNGLAPQAFWKSR
jgi:hypothetical protein